MQLADWALYALAALGNLALCVGFANRVHGTAIPRWAIHALTLLALAGIISAPLVVLGFGWLHGWRIVGRASWAEVPWALQFYLAMCAALAPLVALQWVWNQLRDRTTGIVLVQSAQQHDLRPQALAGVESPAMRRLFGFPPNEASQLAVTHKTLFLERLPAELDGLAIAHLSDLHYTGRVGKQFFSDVVDLVNELDADIVALTGDIVDRARYLDWLPDTVQRLRARHGVYFVLGNHDLYVPIAKLRGMLTSAGMIDLGSRATTLEIHGRQIALAGNEMPWIVPGPDLSLLPADAGLRIALSHAPDQLGWGRRHRFDLLLAGHNHGGQVRMPIIGATFCPSRYGARYASGVFYARPTVMHVSRGVSGELPLRWNCPPEISLLTLTSARSLPRQSAAERDKRLAAAQS